MKKFRPSHHDRLAELNITPLLDLVFVLLVIFIITTPQLVNNLEVSLPSNQQTPPKRPPPKPQRISISASGEIVIEGRVFQKDALANEMTLRKSENPDLAVIVQSNEETDYQRLVDVLDVLRKLDISKVGLETVAQ